MRGRWREIGRGGTRSQNLLSPPSSRRPPILIQATELFADGRTVREVAATLQISKSECLGIETRSGHSIPAARVELSPTTAEHGWRYARSKRCFAERVAP